MDEITTPSVSSRTSTITYHSSASASTYEPRGLSPRPRASQSSIIRFAAGGLPHDENAALTPITKVPNHTVHASDGKTSGLRVATFNVGTGATARSGTPSSVSAASGITWWSAASGVPESGDREDEIKLARKTDSGIELGELPAPVPLQGPLLAVTDRRESASSVSASSTSSASTRKSKSRSKKESSSLRHKDTPSASSQHYHRAHPSRQSTASSTSTVKQSRTSNHRLSRSNTASTTSTTIIPNPSSSTATLRAQRPFSQAHAPVSSRRHSPSTSPKNTQGRWDATHPDSKSLRRRRQKREEIEISLGQKYPNDRFKGEFLPFRSEFSHSSDSLCPVRFVKSNDQNLPGSDGTAVWSSAEGSPRVLSLACAEPNGINTTVINAGGVDIRIPNPPTVFTNELAENFNAPVMGNTVIDWKGDEVRRREYEEVDRKRKGLWGWVRRRILCGSGCGLGWGGKEFWEDGDDDSCSVRRYRLALPEEERETPVCAAVTRKRAGGLKVGVVGSIDTELANRGMRDAGMERTPKGLERCITPVDRWSTVGVRDGRNFEIYSGETRRVGTPLGGVVNGGRASNPEF